MYRILAQVKRLYAGECCSKTVPLGAVLDNEFDPRIHGGGDAGAAPQKCHPRARHSRSISSSGVIITRYGKSDKRSMECTSV